MLCPCLSRMLMIGSCMWPEEPSWTLASWAVIQSCPLTASRLDPAASGHLPGLLQTAYRAEVFAVLVALRLTSQSQCKVRLRCDCEGVVKRVCRILHGSSPCTPNSVHFDLWADITDMIEQIGRDHVQITHVSSHVDPLREQCALKGQWAYFHNGVVDVAAKTANLSRSTDFWIFHRSHVRAVRSFRYISRQVQDVLVRVSKAALLSKLDDDDQIDTVQRPVGFGFLLEWGTIPQVEGVARKLVRRFGFRLVKQCRDWLVHCLHASQSLQLKWISWYQLYIDYMMATGEEGPLRFTEWIDPIAAPNAQLIGINFKKRCTWFGYLAKAIMLDLQLDVTFRFTRPCSHVLNLHAGCVTLPWPVDRLEVIEGWMTSHLPRGAHRNGEVVRRLPRAAYRSDFAFQATDYLGER